MNVPVEIATRQPCARCGIVRTVNTGRSDVCRDCKVMTNPDPYMDREWMTDAACAGVDPELFFPDASEQWQPTRDAKRICAGCPVRDVCLSQTPAWDRWSVSGGLTSHERRSAGSVYNRVRVDREGQKAS